jgi:hypothetical protein
MSIYGGFIEWLRHEAPLLLKLSVGVGWYMGLMGYPHYLRAIEERCARCMIFIDLEIYTYERHRYLRGTYSV